MRRTIHVGMQDSLQGCLYMRVDSFKQALTEYLMPLPVYSILVFTTVKGQVAAAAAALAAPPVKNASARVNL